MLVTFDVLNPIKPHTESNFLKPSNMYDKSVTSEVSIFLSNVIFSEDLKFSRIFFMQELLSFPPIFISPLVISLSSLSVYVLLMSILLPFLSVIYISFPCIF